MSETTTIPEFDHMECDDCEKPVRVNRVGGTGLEIKCGCDSRSIKVKRALPLAWS